MTPAWKAVLGVLAWPDIASLPFTPDLAVLCTNASRNLALLEELGEKGCKTCIILSAPASQHEDLRGPGGDATNAGTYCQGSVID